MKMVPVFLALPLSAQESLSQKVVVNLTVVWSAVKMVPVFLALFLCAQERLTWVPASLTVEKNAVKMEPVFLALYLCALETKTWVVASLTVVLTAVKLAPVFLALHLKCASCRWTLSALTATPVTPPFKTAKAVLCKLPCFMLEAVVT